MESTGNEIERMEFFTGSGVWEAGNISSFLAKPWDICRHVTLNPSSNNRKSAKSQDINMISKLSRRFN